MIKTYKEYINYHPFWQNQGWKINFIRKLMIDIDNNKYQLKDKQKDEILEKLYDIENDILEKINDWLDKALLIKASIS